MVALKRKTESNRKMTELFKKDKDFRNLTNFLKELNKTFTWEEMEILFDRDVELSSSLGDMILEVINQEYFLGGQKSKLMLKIKFKEIKEYIGYVNSII